MEDFDSGSDSGDSDEILEVGTIRVNNVKESDKKSISAFLVVEGQLVNFLLDTGAECCLIPKSFLPQKCHLSHPFPKLRMYDGSTIESLGTVRLKVINKKNGISCNVKFIVVDKGSPILDFQTILKLKLMTVNYNNISCTQLTKTTNWESLKVKYGKLFSAGLGEFKDTYVKISLRENARPIFCKARPVPFALREKVDMALDRAVKDGTLEKVDSSDWASPTVNVTKSSGDIRLCSDFKNTLNPQILVDEYPQPTGEELFSELAGCKYFTKLDLSKCFEQFIIAEECRNYLTINTHRGLFRHRRMPYGIACAPAICQRFMEEKILKDVLTPCDIAQSVKVILDDILIGAATEEKCYELSDRVLKRIHDAGGKLNSKKCEFGMQRLKYYGHVISEDGLATDDEKIKVIQDAPVPKSKKELKSFLGLVHYYGRFCKDLSTIAYPLNALLKQNVDFIWSQDCDAAFERIKKILVTSPILAHYDPKRQLFLQCDASPYGLGVVLSQLNDSGEEHPVAFANRSLSDTEKRYAQIDREALAIMYGVVKFQKYLFGREFTLVTDHKPLVHILGEKTSLPSLAAGRSSIRSFTRVETLILMLTL